MVLYKSYVRSLIDYGCFIYYPTRKKSSHKLEKIQYTAIRKALGYRFSTPTNVILDEAKVTTIHERTRFLCHNFLIKASSNSGLASYEYIESFAKKTKKSKRKRKKMLQKCIEEIGILKRELIIDKDYGIYTVDYNIIIADIKINLDIGHQLAASVNPNTTLSTILLNNKAIPIYTDASKSADSESTGCACLLDDTIIQESLPKKHLHLHS